MPQIMSGVRVLEVADFVFVPAAGGILSDWGADVIKVEHHEQGDPMRGQTMFHPNHKGPLKDFNALIETSNRGKRSIGLNLGSPEGRQVLYGLAKSCDVFLTSKLKPVRQKLGFDIDDIRKQNPDIIYARGSGHGVRGDESDSPGFDIVDFWYRSGSATGVKPLEFDGLPAQPGAGFGDLTSAMNLAGGISAALYHRERTGEALTVEVSLLGSGMWSVGGAITLSELYKVSASQAPAGQAPNPLVNVYQTADGRWIAFACMQAERYWPSFCELINRPDIITDERFATIMNLEKNSREAVKIIGDEIRKRPFAEWVERLRAFTGAWTAAQDAYTVTTDSQAEANGYLVKTKSSTGEDIVFVQPPVQFDESPVQSRPAPQFNADGDSVLAELGLDTEQILGLKLAGAVT